MLAIWKQSNKHDFKLFLLFIMKRKTKWKNTKKNLI